MTNITSRISPRMAAIEAMVLPGILADVGTDHGFIPLHMLISGSVDFACLTDINPGPLGAARNNAAEFNAPLDKCVFLLGPGLVPLDSGSADTVIIAGMGGETIRDILGLDFEKTCSFKRFVLQPRTRCDELRMYLLSKGFVFEDYSLAEERGRICQIFAVRPPGYISEDFAVSGISENSRAASPVNLNGFAEDFGSLGQENFPEHFPVDSILLKKKDPLLIPFIKDLQLRLIRVEQGLMRAEATDSSEALADCRNRLEELLRVKKSITAEN